LLKQSKLYSAKLKDRYQFEQDSKKILMKQFYLVLLKELKLE